MKKLITLFIITLLTFQIHAQGIDKPQYQIITHRAGVYLGTFTMELFPAIAPMHVSNFDSLVNLQYYDSTAFHRVVPGFVIQGGDPNSIHGPISTWGQGDPSQPTVPAEFNVVRHLRGIVGAARDTDPNSATSQFYICVASATFLDGNYTVYGQVTSGMSLVDTIVLSPRDVNDNPLQKIEMFITKTGVSNAVPAAPSLTSPANAANGVLNTQNFQWSAVPTAVMYTIEFSTDATFSNIVLTKNAGNNFSTVPDLPGSSTLYWRVKANNGGHESLPSNVYVINSATSAPDLVYPADLNVNVNLNPVFEWTAAPQATDYTLQVSTSSVFSGASLIHNITGVTGTTHQISGFNPNTLYYWRMRSFNSGVAGYFSPKYSFTTGTTVGLSEINSTSSLNIKSLFPNPAKTEVNIELNSTVSDKVSISIFDLSGKMVYSKNYSVIAGENSFAIPASGFENGIYLLQIEQNGEKISRRIEISR